jgi:hypothetical protein
VGIRCAQQRVPTPDLHLHLHLKTAIRRHTIRRSILTAGALTLTLAACSSGAHSTTVAKTTKVSATPAASMPASATPSPTAAPTAPASVVKRAPAPAKKSIAPAALPSPRVISSAATGATETGAGAPAPAPVANPSPPALPAAAGRTLLAIRGSGSTSSPKFTAPASWTLNFAYDCSNVPDATNFQIFPTGSDPNSPVATVNQLTEKGSSSQRYTTAGVFYLVINTDCAWQISVTTG